MFEKVNKYHPDKVADRIAGAIVDFAYTQSENPKIAVEVLIGHNNCYIIAESSVNISLDTIRDIVYRIAGQQHIEYIEEPQDPHLADNQEGAIRCGDNGIFKGVPVNIEEIRLNHISKLLENTFNSDGKYIIDDDKKEITICQSNATNEQIKNLLADYIDYTMVINPLGEWTGGTTVDTGATNRKLGSDMGRAVTGGGLHGKDLSKADVSINIYAQLLATTLNKEVNIHCSIGDEFVNVEGRQIPYKDIVETARKFIAGNYGFEKFAETGIIGSNGMLVEW